MDKPFGDTRIRVCIFDRLVKVNIKAVLRAITLRSAFKRNAQEHHGAFRFKRQTQTLYAYSAEFRGAGFALL